MILVTGGAGFIGSAMVRALSQQRRPVRVFDDFSRGTPRRLAGLTGLDVVTGDIRDSRAVHQAMPGIDTVIHLAAINGTQFFYEKPAEVLAVGIQGMVNVMAACQTARVHNLLVASSSEVYQTPPRIPTGEDAPLTIPDAKNPRYSYAASKIATEMLALHRDEGPPERVMIVRPHNIYGPDMGEEHVIPQLIRRAVASIAEHGGDPVPLSLQGDGSQSRAFMHIDDFVRAMLVVLERGENNMIYHLGNSEETTIGALARMIMAKLGRNCQLLPSPVPAGGTERRCPDIGRLRGLGFTPTVSLAEGLDDAISWYDEPADMQS